MENWVDDPSSLGDPIPGVKEKLAVGPVAPLFPQLPQVSQFLVSSTLSSTVVPSTGVGVGLATGVGLGVGVALGVGLGAAFGVGVGVGLELGVFPADVDELLLPAERLPPQELTAIDTQMARTQAASA